MSDKDLSNMPHKIRGTEDIWWYEAPRGIQIITSHSGGRCEIATIPWRTIRAALKRKDKP